MAFRKHIAIVTPWFGKDLKGGAEQLVWQIATRLSQRDFHIEVLTTCCKSFFDDWGTNHLPSGEFKEKGIIIRRFPVNSWNKKDHYAINRNLLSIHRESLKPGVSPVSFENTDIFVNENINSDKLLSFLDQNKYKYDAFLFIPYLYGIILKGLPKVAEQAYLQPCLHDEVYAYLPQVENIFRLTKRIFYNSEGEAKLAERLFGPGIIPKGSIIGAGIEVPKSIFNKNLESHYIRKGEKFLLYVGKRDPCKNTDFLIDCFKSFKNIYTESDLKLILIGAGNNKYNDMQNNIIDLGFVSEKEKYALMTSCIALVNPSINESFSRVIMESWFCHRPVAVHGKCLATALAVKNSGGGWIAEQKEEWINWFRSIETMTQEDIDYIARLGFYYASKYSDWEQVIDNYEREFEKIVKPVFSPISKKKLLAIHQILPNLDFGDAISNQAINIRKYLQNKGFNSEIYVRYIDNRMVDEGKIFSPDLIQRTDGLIYHHSIGSELTTFVIKHPGPKCLAYHNITPSEFFMPYNLEFATLLDQGRKDLHILSRYFPISAGDSNYNVRELENAGFTGSEVFPIIINPEFWNFTPNPELMENLQDGNTNIIFVGRVVPNKRQDHLIESFVHYRFMDPGSRLFIIGFYDPNDDYFKYLKYLINVYHLEDSVSIVGQVNLADLHAFYRTSHLYWSMSEHEGFGIPLIEAMWFNIPVLAYKSSAVSETLGHTALVFTEKENKEALSALAYIVINDKELNQKIIDKQKLRREYFLPNNVFPILDNIIKKMTKRQ